jgi:LPXTG-motif cell wall-anchored protein
MNRILRTAVAVLAATALAGIATAPAVASDSRAGEPLDIMWPSDGARFYDLPRFYGDGAPGATVTVLVAGASVGETTVDDAGDWFLPVAETDLPAEGEHFDATVRQDDGGTVTEVVVSDLHVDVDGSHIRQPLPGLQDEITGDFVFVGNQNYDGIVVLRLVGTTAEGDEVEWVAQNEGEPLYPDVTPWEGTWTSPPNEYTYKDWNFDPAENLAEGEYTIDTWLVTEDGELDLGNGAPFTVIPGAGGDESGSDESGGDESGSDENGSDESGADENGTDAGDEGGDESGSDESGAAESGSDEAGAAENGTDENGAAESGAAESGAAESGAAEGGSDDDGADENGADENGADENGAGEDLPDTGAAGSLLPTAAVVLLGLGAGLIVLRARRASA